MIIQIEGINTRNKGAELMLVAILEEINTRFPNSVVLLNPDSSLDLSLLPKFNLNVKLRKGRKLTRFANAVKSKFGLNLDNTIFGEHYCSKNVDLILDASGFKYSDQWNRSEQWISNKNKYYEKIRRRKTRLVFLPQAFGPFETKNGIDSVKMILENADLIFARERISFNHLNGIDRENTDSIVNQSCDFTFKVKGTIPPELSHLEGKVAIIPNYKMISHGGYESGAYMSFLISIINYLHSQNIGVFLLNHEGKQDYELCEKINAEIGSACTIVSGLTAKEIKGVISLSMFVVSSRFHGVASSLSQGVPCLATSWNHKYEMLFEDFKQKGYVISYSEGFAACSSKIDRIINNRELISQSLLDVKTDLVKQIDEMWGHVFEEQKNED